MQASPAGLRRIFFWCGLTLYAITAWNSDGFHQGDEHFQILEASLKITENLSLSDLPWEFSAKMRPSGQIWLSAGFCKFADLVGVRNRFDQAALLRLLLGLLAFFGVWKLTAHLVKGEYNDKAQLWGFAAAALLWFMPYIHGRHSSELASALAFVAGLNLMFRAADADKYRSLWYGVAGFFFAASFWFRFQSAFALLPLVIYLLLAQPRWSHHFGFGDENLRGKLLLLGLMTAGAAAASLLALVADWRYYGEAVLTPWRYFSENLLQGKANHFGVSPWWGYFRSFIKAGIPPVALALTGVAFWFIMKRRISFIAWIFIFFLGVHFAIQHKELRFLFPLAVFLPTMVAAAANASINYSGYISRAKRISLWIILVPLITLNLAAAAMSAVLPADSQIAALKALSRIAQREQTPMRIAPETKQAGFLVGYPFRFFARDLPADLYLKQPANPGIPGPVYRIYFEKVPAGATCEVLKENWWPNLPAMLPPDFIYRERFMPYRIERCDR